MSFDEIIVNSPINPMYWGILHNDSPHPIKIKNITWSSISQFVYGSILQNPSVVSQIRGIKNLHRITENLYIGELIQHSIDLLFHACQILYEQNPQFRQQLDSTTNHPLYSDDKLGISIIDEVWQSQRSIGTILERIRQQTVDEDLDYIYVNNPIPLKTSRNKKYPLSPLILPTLAPISQHNEESVEQGIFPSIPTESLGRRIFSAINEPNPIEYGITLDTAYEIRIGEQRFNTIKDFILFNLCLRLDPNLSIIPTAHIFEQVQAGFFDRTVFHSLHHILSLKTENQECFGALQEIPIQFRVVDEEGFLMNYINNHTNSILKFLKKDHTAFATPNIGLYENTDTIFHQWVKLFQLPALMENLAVLDNFKSSKKLEKCNANNIILYLSTMLSDCPWSTQLDIPKLFQKEIHQPQEIARIIWGYISANITRMQDQQLRNIDQFIKHVKYQVERTDISVEQIFRAIHKGIVLFMHLEDTRFFRSEYLTFSLLLCNIKLKNVQLTGTTIGIPQFWESLSQDIDNLTHETYGHIMDIVNSIYEQQTEFSDRERARLIVFG